jgi:CBS domain containing-hemolysin-like protein
MPEESINMNPAVVNPETACGRNPSSGINILEILVIALLLTFNGIFAMYEIALVSARRSSMEDEAKSGRLGAATALELLREPEKVLSAIQVGITLIGIVSGAYGGLTLAGDVAGHETLQLRRVSDRMDFKRFDKARSAILRD